jgi:hypothetical protein
MHKLHAFLGGASFLGLLGCLVADCLFALSFFGSGWSTDVNPIVTPFVFIVIVFEFVDHGRIHLFGLIHNSETFFMRKHVAQLHR